MESAMIKPIYLDTNLWNRLFEQEADALRLLDDLKASNANLALSGQTVCELSRTFQSYPQKAQQLFQYIKLYVDAGVIGAHSNMEQLFREIDAMHARASVTVAYYSPTEYDALKIEIDRMAGGDFSEVARKFIDERRLFGESTREDQKQHFVTRPDMRGLLRAIPKSDLPAWLQREMFSDQGTALLAGHILRIFESVEIEVAINNAFHLLRLPTRISESLVRADLFSNWRCANTDSVPRDLVDDMYHVLNASYCSIYATADANQMKYASLLLQDVTQVAFYDDQSPIDEWLMSLVEVAVATAIPRAEEVSANVTV
jgi:hypothetical protein